MEPVPRGTASRLSRPNVIRTQPTEDGYAHMSGRARGEGKSRPVGKISTISRFGSSLINRTFSAIRASHKDDGNPPLLTFFGDFAARRRHGDCLLFDAKHRIARLPNGVGE